MVIPTNLRWLHNYVTRNRGTVVPEPGRSEDAYDRDDAMTAVLKIDDGGYETIHLEAKVNIVIHDAQTVAYTFHTSTTAPAG